MNYNPLSNVCFTSEAAQCVVGVPRPCRAVQNERPVVLICCEGLEKCQEDGRLCLVFLNMEELPYHTNDQLVLGGSKGFDIFVTLFGSSHITLQKCLRTCSPRSISPTTHLFLLFLSASKRRHRLRRSPRPLFPRPDVRPVSRRVRRDHKMRLRP